MWASACGGTAERRQPSVATVRTEPSPTAPAGRTHTSPAQRREIAQRKARQRAHHSSAATAQRIAGLPAGRQRTALVAALRDSVLRDARRRARRHQLDGPFRGAFCRVLREDRGYARSVADAPVLRYDCLAYTVREKNTDPPIALGSPFLARVDFARNRYAWCLFTPVGGEGTHTASTFTVPPDPACAER